MKDLVIKLPPECMKNKIHFIETTLSRLPNKSKMDIIKKHNPLIKLRVFNKDEDNMIREYWSKFQKVLCLKKTHFTAPFSIQQIMYYLL